MTRPPRTGRRLVSRIVNQWALLCAIALGSATSAARGQPEALALPEQAPAARAMPLTLADCVGVGLAQQSALAAHRASLAAAEAQKQALDNMHLAAVISKELCIRRQQAAEGVTIAAAGLQQAEWDTTYAVTRNYFSVIYATKQEAVVTGLLKKLKKAQDKAALLVKGGDPDVVVTNIDIDRLVANIDLIKLRQIEAAQGVKRAGAALREAMGVGASYCLVLDGADLPPLQEKLCREELIALALARRGDMVQASTAQRVTELEVHAQDRHCLFPTKPTFASVADVHVRPIPQGISDGDYRPGAVGLEMPTTLVGKRADRVQRAHDLNSRAVAVVEKTQGLITLEVEDAYFKWEEAALKLGALAQTYQRALKVSDSVTSRFEIGKISGEELIRSQTLADQSQAAYNEALYNHALALAALERSTAGGFVPSYRHGGVRRP
jgi:outer membrane protein TolC